MNRTESAERVRLDPAERRNVILDAATEAFAKTGYSEVKISAIAQAAGASDALIYRYFSGKEQLYAEVVQRAINTLLASQAEALAKLPPFTSVRDHVRVATVAYLDHIAAQPGAWALPMRNPGSEPANVAAIRAAAKASYVQALDQMLPQTDDARRPYALWGYYGFLDAACLYWVEAACPEEGRWPLIEAALGALQGAIGDWGG
jgi:AcrR family transcriptional regulator